MQTKTSHGWTNLKLKKIKRIKIVNLTFFFIVYFCLLYRLI